MMHAALAHSTPTCERRHELSRSTKNTEPSHHHLRRKLGGKASCCGLRREIHLLAQCSACQVAAPAADLVAQLDRIRVVLSRVGAFECTRGIQSLGLCQLHGGLASCGAGTSEKNLAGLEIRLAVHLHCVIRTFEIVLCVSRGATATGQTHRDHRCSSQCRNSSHLALRSVAIQCWRCPISLCGSSLN